MTKTTVSWMCGASLGAGTMLLLDPARGRRRRALLRDKLASASHTTAHAASVTTRDLRHRVAGAVAEVRARGDHQPVDDDVLVARIRSAMGHHVAHPSAVEVTCRDGRVSIQGPVLADEIQGLLAAVRRVAGVRDLENRLEVHQTPGHVPGLQGGTGRRQPRTAFMRHNWSPTARLVAASGAAGLMAWGARRPAPLAATASFMMGAGLLARSLTNQELRRLLGLAGRRTVGLAGHRVARLFGTDRKHQLDEDL